jgi:hypothetical protein
MLSVNMLCVIGLSVILARIAFWHENMLSVILLGAFRPVVILLSVILLTMTKISEVMMSVILLSVILLRVILWSVIPLGVARGALSV